MMKLSQFLWIAVLVSATMIATGCGGGGGTTTGGKTPTPTPTPTVTATPTPTPANIVMVTFPAPTPLAVAEKIGNGSWSTASLSSAATLTVGLPTGVTRYSIAVACPAWNSVSGLQNEEWVIQADLADGSSYTPQVCASFPQSYSTITGNVDATAIPGAAKFNVYAPGPIGYINAASGPFSSSVAITGTDDVGILAYNSANSILAVKILRSQHAPGTVNGGNTVTFASSDEVTTQTLSVNNAPLGFTQSTSFTYITANGSFLLTDSASQYAVVPAAEAQAGDSYYVADIASAGNGQIVSASQSTTTAGPITLTLPNPWSATAPVAAVFPTFTFDYTGLSGSSLVDLATLKWSHSSQTYYINVAATANYQNGATAVIVPDLTALSGFFAMAPASTTEQWTTTMMEGTPWYDLGESAPLHSVAFAEDSGSYTQP